MRTKKRANFARLSGTQFAVVTLFRKGLDLRTRPFLSSRGLPIATSMDDERQGSLKQGLARLYATSTFPIMHLICPPKFCITLVFHFSWVLQLSQEKLKTVLMQESGGQRRCIMGNVEVAFAVIAFTALKHNFVCYLCFLAILITKER